MPLAASPHPGGAGGFALASFPGPVPDVVTLENLIGTTYVEGGRRPRLRRRFERIGAAALSMDDALAPIAQTDREKPQVNRKAELYDLDLTGVTWRKSTVSGAENDCVEIAELPGGGRAVRDSKDPERKPLRFTASVWAAFCNGVIAGDF